MEIGLGSSKISYQPGDSIGIIAPNRSSHVEVVLDRLQTAHHSCGGVSLETVVQSSTGEHTSVKEILSYRYLLVLSLSVFFINCITSLCIYVSMHP
jgi:sulfite reductase alpha subunit-like flavoprotein